MRDQACIGSDGRLAPGPVRGGLGGDRTVRSRSKHSARGSLAFDFESMNELHFYDATATAIEAGFRRILIGRCGRRGPACPHTFDVT